MRTDTLAYVAFGIIFLVCTVVLLGFVGVTPGLLWMAAVAPLVVFMLILLYWYSRLGDGGAPRGGSGLRGQSAS